MYVCLYIDGNRDSGFPQDDQEHVRTLTSTFDSDINILFIKILFLLMYACSLLYEICDSNSAV